MSSCGMENDVTCPSFYFVQLAKSLLVPPKSRALSLFASFFHYLCMGIALYDFITRTETNKERKRKGTNYNTII